MAKQEIMEKGSDEVQSPPEMFVRPKCDIYGDEEKLIVRLEMPGVEKKNLDISISDNQLRVIGRRDEPKDSGEFVIRERPFGNYRAAYTLDDTVNQNAVDASLENGVLTLTMKIKEADKPRKIQISAR
jgi:HSP20 family protein